MVDPLKRLKGIEALIDKLNALGHYTVLISSIQFVAQARDPVQAMRLAALCIDRDSRLYLPPAEWAPAVLAEHPLPEDGLRDVRDYKIRLRPDAQSLGSSSPFNIKVKSFFIDRLDVQDIVDLLQQHTDATDQVFEPAAVAAFADLTQGQPWLVNALANQIVSEILDNDSTQPITEAMVWQAKDALIRFANPIYQEIIPRVMSYN